MDYLTNSNVYLRGRDLDGKLILMFDCRTHIRGAKDMEELKKCLVYWYERAGRESNGDKITIVFDMKDTGLSNMDLEYTKMIVNTSKLYYPGSVNWILIYEMPWIMNGEFEAFLRAANNFLSFFSSHLSNH